MKIHELLENVELTPEDQQLIAAVDRKYPRAGAVVAGLTLRPDVPNTSSIAASLEEYHVMPGIRVIPMNEFDGPRSVFNSADDFAKSEHLAQQIAASREISPLIIVCDQQGLYILEGSHRYVGLYSLKITAFPAMLVVELPELQQ